MAGRILQLEISREHCLLLVEAVRQYADQAFPEGCADCMLVARYELLQVADALESGYGTQEQGRAPLNRRLRPMCKVAVQNYFDGERVKDPELARAYACLLGALSLRTG